jgi:hypothetical protein
MQQDLWENSTYASKKIPLISVENFSHLVAFRNTVDALNAMRINSISGTCEKSAK